MLNKVIDKYPQFRGNQTGVFKFSIARKKHQFGRRFDDEIGSEHIAKKISMTFIGAENRLATEELMPLFNRKAEVFSSLSPFTPQRECGSSSQKHSGWPWSLLP